MILLSSDIYTLEKDGKKILFPVVGGVVVDDTKVTDPNMPIPANEFVLHKGKKVHLKIVVK